MNLIDSKSRSHISNFFFFELGTGKTKTVCASIIEMVQTTDKCVLVLANSNAACDEIALRLAGLTKKDEIYRLYAKSYNIALIHQDIVKICNARSGKIEYPPLDFLYRFRVLICTTLTAGTIARTRGADRVFDASHFSHIFFDEAACTQEPVTLVGIAGIYGAKFEFH